MTKIAAEIVADSVNEFGDRITSILCTFPRMILAELNTHRMFSRNSASSRAIPFKKMVEVVENDPFIPIAWQKDHKGMQGVEYFTDPEDIAREQADWLDDRNHAIKKARIRNKRGVTKQLCNRLLEPFMWHKVLITATEWENFFVQRCPQYEFTWDHIDTKVYRSRKDLIKDGASYLKDKIEDDLFWLKLSKSGAEIHMQLLAEAIWDAMNESTPKQLEAGEWHLPFGDNIDVEKFYTLREVDMNSLESVQGAAIKIATARCARTSYTTIEEGKELSYEDLIRIHDTIIKNHHMSPLEHIARAMSKQEYHVDKQGFTLSKDNEGWCGNFKGWIQYRKTIPNENYR